MDYIEKTFKIKNPNSGEEKTYLMREMNGEEDLAFQYQFTNPQTGALNIRDLWIKRLSRTIISPQMPETELKKIASWEFNSLIHQWQLMNEGVVATFLPNSEEPKTT